MAKKKAKAKKKTGLLKRIAEKLKERKLSKLVAETDVAPLSPAAPPKMHREAHESYKIGCCTVRVMSSKAELQSRKLALEADNERARADSKKSAEKTTEKTFDEISRLIAAGEAPRPPEPFVSPAENAAEHLKDVSIEELTKQTGAKKAP